VPVIQVKVKPNARRRELTIGDDGAYLASLVSPPADGKANAELMVLLADHFGVAKSAIAIKSGASSRYKRVIVDTPGEP
jgi:hypothetical protein